MPDNYTFASASGGTTVLFPTTATQNLAVNSPEDYWNNTTQPIPQLIVPCYVNGTSTGPAGTYSSIVSIGNDQNSLTPTENPIATVSQVSSVWGEAYQKSKSRMFFSALSKRHVGFGTQGIGGIYIGDQSGASFSFTSSFTLQGVTTANGGLLA